METFTVHRILYTFRCSWLLLAKLNVTPSGVSSIEKVILTILQVGRQNSASKIGNNKLLQKIKSTKLLFFKQICVLPTNNRSKTLACRFCGCTAAIKEELKQKPLLEQERYSPSGYFYGRHLNNTHYFLFSDCILRRTHLETGYVIAPRQGRPNSKGPSYASFKPIFLFH